MKPTTSSPTLHQYDSFHSMVCSYRTARDCVNSFVRSGGTILFLPSDYKCCIEKEPLQVPTNYQKCRRCPHDYEGILTVFSYYLLVIISLTGLSTLIAKTDFVDAREFELEENEDTTTAAANNKNNENNQEDDDMDSTRLLLRSIRNPSIQVEENVLKYIVCRQVGSLDSSSSSSSSSSRSHISSLRLKRRFEYDFRLVGCNVIMLHFVSSPSITTRKEEEEDVVFGSNSTSSERKYHQTRNNSNNETTTTPLHLVEIVHIRNPVARKFAWAVLNLVRFLYTLGTVVLFRGRGGDFPFPPLQPQRPVDQKKHT